MIHCEVVGVGSSQLIVIFLLQVSVVMVGLKLFAGFITTVCETVSLQFPLVAMSVIVYVPGAE